MSPVSWLDPVLGSTARVRLLRVLANHPDRGYSEAELARAIGMSRNTVNLAVRQLSKSGVIELRGVGRSSEVRLHRKAPLAGALRDLFRCEERAVDALRRAVASALRPGESCILFGSAARGELTPRSDLDLLIISRSRSSAADAAVRVGQAARQVWPARYQILQLTPGEVRKKWDGPLLRNIRDDALLLAGEPLEGFL